MSKSYSRTNAATDLPPEYEPPMLVAVGDASVLVMGLPGGGWDGPYGMTSPDFEFQDDE